MKKVIDWKAKESLARKMSDDQLHHAFLDCVQTVSLWRWADDLNDDAGYYFDEASIYWRELKKRGKAS